ncbi:sporulation protein YunB [Clostridium sp. BJN0001]|uniref:sporulation protein YunB n=1 Tax=Clostridium sp. BJN0001 TaxID=2930219 RepID=UPI001FD3CCBD|nr:sporulation protein YunB [Clostridium sp. BJN0001]
MEYYTKRKKTGRLKKFIIFILIISIINLIFYFFDARVLPHVADVSETIAQSKTIDIINETSVEILNDDFNYDELVKISRDDTGKINLIQSDTAKLNKIASSLAIKTNEKLRKMKDIEVNVPLGWSTDKGMLFNIGPKINVAIEPVGNMNITYESDFESAGINQTRHKIYFNVEAKVRVMLPFKSRETTINTQIPVTDTIVVGEIPSGAIIQSK